MSFVQVNFFFLSWRAIFFNYFAPKRAARAASLASISACAGSLKRSWRCFFLTSVSSDAGAAAAAPVWPNFSNRFRFFAGKSVNIYA